MKRFQYQKKILKATIEKENFLSNIISISVNGKNQNVLPREVVYDVSKQMNLFMLIS
jgi:large subunit ribosomal protein L25